jgi:hypothetical protein
VCINDGGGEVRMMRPNFALSEIGSEASDITYEHLRHRMTGEPNEKRAEKSRILRADFDPDGVDAPPTASMCQGRGIEDREDRRGVHGER